MVDVWSVVLTGVGGVLLGYLIYKYVGDRVGGNEYEFREKKIEKKIEEKIEKKAVEEEKKVVEEKVEEEKKVVEDVIEIKKEESNAQKYLKRLLIVQSVIRRFLSVRKKQKLIEALKIREYVAKELYTTEKTYVDQLVSIIACYQKPMKDSKLISQEKIKILFAHIEELISLNTSIYSDLHNASQLAEAAKKKNIKEKEKNVSLADEIGKIFLKHAAFLKAYAFYINDYDQAMKVLNELKKDVKIRSTLLDEGQKKNSFGLTLEALLITGVQRIPRYVLLLKELQKRTPIEHPSYSSISKTLDQISAIALTVNTSKLMHERQTAVVDLQLQNSILHLPDYLTGNLIQPGRELISTIDCVLYRPNFPKSKPAKRRLLLFSDMLICLKEVVSLISKTTSYVYKFDLSAAALISSDCQPTTPNASGFASEILHTEYGFEIVVPSVFFTPFMREKFIDSALSIHSSSSLSSTSNSTTAIGTHQYMVPLIFYTGDNQPLSAKFVKDFRDVRAQLLNQSLHSN